MSLSVYVSVCFYRFQNLFLCMFVYLSVSPSLFIHLSICLSIYLSIYLSLKFCGSNNRCEHQLSIELSIYVSPIFFLFIRSNPCGVVAGLQHTSKRIPLPILRSLSDKNPEEKYEAPYPARDGLNSIAAVLLYLALNNPLRLMSH